MEFYELIGFQSGATEPESELPSKVDLARSVILTDFDGTLVDLAETPHGITVDPRIERVLARLLDITGGAVGVISGRKMSDLRKFLPGFEGMLIGSHGAEWYEEGEARCHAAAESADFEHLRIIVKAYAEHEPAVLLEEKPCSIVLHFRQAPEKLAEAERFLSVLIDQWPGFTLHHAKMALEVMPELVSKRLACEGLMKRWPGRTPIAFGDDTTDEGMLGLAVDAGGLGVKVGEGHTIGNRRVGGPADVLSLLERWAEEAQR